MKKFLSNNYILAVGEEIDGVEITNQEYNEIVTAMNNKPEKEGFYYKLRDDNKQWDEFEIIPDPDVMINMGDSFADNVKKAEAYDYLTGRSDGNE